MTTINKLISEFKNKDLLDQALTHRSWVNENKKTRGTNERLEFLGDAILEFVVSDEIYKIYPDKEEGYLTALRSNIVNTSNLHLSAKKLGLGDKLFLSKGEEETGGRENKSLLADTLEAIIGAIYIDRGIGEAASFIKEHLLSNLSDWEKKPLKDAKSRFQEKIQSEGFPAPRYRVISEEGPDHAKVFVVEVLVNNKVYAKGSGRNKAAAEQNSAEIALQRTSL